MSLGLSEIVLILIVVLILFGGKRIPELAKALGRAQYEYKKSAGHAAKRSTRAEKRHRQRRRRRKKERRKITDGKTAGKSY